MTEDKCPFCGAERIQRKMTGASSWYECGTYGGKDKSYNYESSKCKDRQISQLQEKLEAWRKFNGLISSFGSQWPEEERIKKLKELGEI